MKTKQKNQTAKRRSQRPEPVSDVTLPFIEHLYELRRRLVYVTASVLFFSVAAYFVQQQIVGFLLRPSHGQQFIYTSPGGGINFLFSVCMYVGIAASIPVIVYHVLGFLTPLVRAHTQRLLLRYSLISGALAVTGFCFGYFLGLPAALHFLSNQFTSHQIRALFTLQEYMNFLMIYLLGSALLFQLPIILLFIDRIKPLKPRRLLGAERYVIVAAFIIAMIMTPTTDIFNQSLIAVPIILIYNVSVLLIWKKARSGRPDRIAELLEHDRAVRASRLAASRQPLPPEPLEPLDVTAPVRRLAVNYLGGPAVVDVRLARS
ncbi:MAG TPA: twin-arginine translocase subunit TatC [Candidatus Saccharimonadales bacterium]|nr:twin-arginine translocase subunit TatC [Candidatus Saccharimonadales bacterium]